MPPWNPGIWIGQNWIYIAGWVAFLTILYKGYGMFNRLTSYGKAITTLQSDMDIIKTNHLPHVQEELQKLNANVIGLREDVRDSLGGLRDDIRAVLIRL